MAVTEYEAVKADYDFENASLGQMMKLESVLNDARLLVADVTTKLGLFASVWAAVGPQNLQKLGDTLTRIFRLRQIYEN